MEVNQIHLLRCQPLPDNLCETTRKITPHQVLEKYEISPYCTRFSAPSLANIPDCAYSDAVPIKFGAGIETPPKTNAYQKAGIVLIVALVRPDYGELTRQHMLAVSFGGSLNLVQFTTQRLRPLGGEIYNPTNSLIF
ncbi:hypothetical protein VIM7927_03085 [Vibrio mangrovi]|uniref:Uncharacterized protein n=1 Tax=Vibrio mangrovi TaxID=474394 RepID=A0A1Y6IVV6_9VIBR|nr:hypothetical protein VIM7927_03085 [Vibrio mangrovi]